MRAFTRLCINVVVPTAANCLSSTFAQITDSSAKSSSNSWPGALKFATLDASLAVSIQRSHLHEQFHVLQQAYPLYRVSFSRSHYAILQLLISVNRKFSFSRPLQGRQRVQLQKAKISKKLLHFLAMKRTGIRLFLVSFMHLLRINLPKTNM